MTPALRFLSAAITTASPDEASGSLFIAGVFLNGGKPRLTPSAAAFDETRGGALTRMIECGAFDAKAGSTLFLGETEAFPNGFAVLGLGEEKDFSRKVFAECAAKAARAFAWAESQAYAVQEWLPPKTSGKSSARLFSTAVLNALTPRFTLKTEHDDGIRTKRIFWIDDLVTDKLVQGLDEGVVTAEAMSISRGLADLPGNVCTPAYLAEAVQNAAAGMTTVEVEVLDEHQIEELGMGAFLSVAKGSTVPPRFIAIRYRGTNAALPPVAFVGKGITFRPKSNWFSLTMRFRMQNMVGLSFDKDFTLTKTDAQVKRLRLRFDGYIYSPKLVYSVQLGFTSYDTEPLPNGNMNIVRDAIVYYVPSPKWNIGFGQTKIKANRARINSSSALQFVDRSIVNSEFNLDRDFGFFGEYNMRGGEGFNLSAKGSVTLGEGRNWGSSSNGGLAYTGRLELYPLGRFKSKGDVMEGDFEGEEQVKILVAGAYSYNHKASRLKGQRGAVMPDDATRNIGSYFADFILKYRGFAFYTDFMGRSCDRPLFDPQSNAFVYSGQGLNIQTSYLFDKKWEVALRNSTLFPEHEVQPFAGYKRWNQTTVGVTRYIIGHSLKVQADMSYNHRSESFDPDYNRWEIRFQLELGL